MNNQRPTSVTVFGVLNILSGSLGLLVYMCCGSLTILIVALLDQPIQGNPADVEKLQQVKEVIQHLIDDVPGLVPAYFASLISSVILAGALLIGGIGLLKLQGWGRKLCIAVALASILVQLAWLGYSMAILDPAVEEVEQKAAARFGAETEELEAIFVAVRSNTLTLISLTYSTLLLIFMLNPTVASAFRPPPPRDEFDYDAHDREIDEYERRRFDEPT